MHVLVFECFYLAFVLSLCVFFCVSMCVCVCVSPVGAEKERAPGTFEPTLGDVLIHLSVYVSVCVSRCLCVCCQWVQRRSGLRAPSSPPWGTCSYTSPYSWPMARGTYAR